MRETCVIEEEIRKESKIMTQNLQKRHLKWENTIEVDFIDIFCKSVHGLTISGLGAVVEVLEWGNEWNYCCFSSCVAEDSFLLEYDSLSQCNQVPKFRGWTGSIKTCREMLLVR